MIATAARFARDDGARAATARALLAHDPDRRRFDPLGVIGHLAGKPSSTRTCFAGIHAIAPPPRGTSLARATEPALIDLLRDALRSALAQPGTKAIAMSGGLDSALILALARELGDATPAITLAIDLPGYGELERTLATARALGVKPIVISAQPAELVLALPDTTVAAEAPIRNLHMASKLVFARALRARGIDVAITGDGADQVFAHQDGRDYLPLATAVMAEGGVELRSPFLDESILAYARQRLPDPRKRELRDVARERLPAAVVESAKSPRLTPALDLEPILDRPALTRALRSLPFLRDVATSDRGRVQLTSLAWLQRRVIEGRS